MKQMHLLEINERLEVLSSVLQYCSHTKECFFGGRIFTPGQRICINQECGSLLDKKAFLFSKIELADVRDYKVSEEIERKIQFTLPKIENDIHWEPKQRHDDINTFRDEY